jgi:hypothetical protein
MYGPCAFGPHSRALATAGTRAPVQRRFFTSRKLSPVAARFTYRHSDLPESWPVLRHHPRRRVIDGNTKNRGSTEKAVDVENTSIPYQRSSEELDS